MDRREFIDSLAARDDHAAEMLGVGKAALSRWVKRPVADRREAILLEGWALLSERKRRKAIREAEQPQP